MTDQAQQDERAKGFADVDSYEDPTPMFTSMDETAGWPAVVALRAWEREQLAPRSGQSLLDVGCGLGDVAIALGGELMPDGRVIGVDASRQMLNEAAHRAAVAGVRATFDVQDATKLPFPDDTFDMVRSERTLQWIDDAQRAAQEMVRVARSGGRVCIIDTDWRTFVTDVGDDDLWERFTGALDRLRSGRPDAGGRIANWLRDAGLADVEVTAQCHIWTEWDPDRSAQPTGFVPIRRIASVLTAGDLLSDDEAERIVRQLEEAGRNDRFFLSLTMFGVCGTAP